MEIKLINGKKQESTSIARQIHPPPPPEKKERKKKKKKSPMAL